ncbi:MAG: hypothetical protein R3C61_22525 [Bacteroidia bacterium]
MNPSDPSFNHNQPNGGGGQLSIRQGQFFTYAVPPGWRVAEDGQFAVVLVAPDNAAVTIMVGNSGLPVNYPPGQYVYEKLMGAGYSQLQLGQPRQGTPVKGCQYAYTFDYTYNVNGVPCRGQATCSVAPSYDVSTMVVTCAASQSNQWASYASWLPQVAAQFSANNGAAFGMRGIMQQNLQNSIAFGEAAKQYREWSQQNWQQVTDQRNQSQDRNNYQFRENIGGVQTYTNPYDSRAVQLPATYNYYWVNRQGATWGTNNPGENPNDGSTQEWIRMERQ